MTTPSARPASRSRDRRRLWIQILVGILVLAMLAPVAGFIVSVL